MKTLLILDKAGQIGCKYTIVEGDYSKFAGLMLNNETQKEKECLEFLIEGIKNETIEFVNSLYDLKNQTWDKKALITYI